MKADSPGAGARCVKNVPPCEDFSAIPAPPHEPSGCFQSFAALARALLYI